MHESSRPEEEIRPPSDRSFGLVFAAFFAIIGFAPLVFSHGPIRIWALVVAAAFLVCALTVPRLLNPLTRLWMQFGLLLHKVTQPIILGLIFFTAIVPVGLLMRWFGKDGLRLKRQPDIRSYWIERAPPGPPPQSMENQF